MQPTVLPPTDDPLLRAALELDAHVAARGWDAPPALFALVPTSALAQALPDLPEPAPGSPEAPDDELSAVEQEDLPEADSLDDLLGRLAWPPVVAGVALAVERVAVPPGPEGEPPDAAAGHPDAVEVRFVIAVTRDGRHVSLLRRRDATDPDAVALGRDVAPALVEALLATLED